MSQPRCPAEWWKRPAFRPYLESALQRLNVGRDPGSSAAARIRARIASLDTLLSALEQTFEANDGGAERQTAPLAAYRGRRAAALAGVAPGGDPSSMTALETVLDDLLDRPSCKLAIYGTLAPGEVNHAVIRSIGGVWRDGFVHGELSRVGWGVDYGFPALTWNAHGPRVPVKLLVAERLPQHWERIDRFEGTAYRRILVPVEDGRGVMAVANIYVARRRGGVTGTDDDRWGLVLPSLEGSLQTARLAGTAPASAVTASVKRQPGAWTAASHVCRVPRS